MDEIEAERSAQPSRKMALQGYYFSFYRDGPDPLFTQSMRFASDAEAIGEGSALLEAQQDLVHRPALSITIVRDAGEHLEWLGAWQWDGVARWAAKGWR